jgi:hypothetical protein
LCHFTTSEILFRCPARDFTHCKEKHPKLSDNKLQAVDCEEDVPNRDPTFMTSMADSNWQPSQEAADEDARQYATGPASLAELDEQ